MFNIKNLSQNQLSAIIALLPLVLISIGFYFVAESHINIWFTVVIFLVIYLICYILISLLLEKFIFRKIKLIYKFIYQTKASRKEETYYKYILPQKSIDEVREDVEKWALQKKAEVEILRNNEAYRKEFLQNLAHEFKTPIFAIQGYVDTLLGGALENEAVNKRFLENAARNVDRIVNLLNDLDEISKLESGEQPLNKRNFVIQDVIKEVFETLSIKCAELHIRCSIKKGCEQPITVYADREKIRQVIINLVDNAIKYGKQNGTIVASVYKTDEQHILVEVTDDGIGITENHLPRIFERFYRADRARSRNAGGSGLGLAICKHIIEAHEQTLHVRSKPDVGTTIGFTLEKRKTDA